MFVLPFLIALIFHLLISVTIAFITFKILPSKFIFFILISTLKLPF